MDGIRTNILRKRPNPEDKSQGSAKKGKWQYPVSDRSSENSTSSDTVYRILCPSRKIGSVIGKGGGIVKALREETQAKITVTDSVPGSDERVILLVSPSTKLVRRQNTDKSGNDLDTNLKDDDMEPHCVAQDALLKIHERIVEEDLGRTENDDGNEIVVTARLLVPNNQIGCILGRKGDIIQRLRGETAANIRILPADHLPSCAMSTDELVQIAGKSAVVRKALYEVSTLLHQNPRKENPPLSFPLAYSTQGIHPPGPPMANMQPPRNLAWPHHDPDNPIPLPESYENQPSGFGPGDFDDFLPTHGDEPASEFSIKLLCSAAKIGGVIGKGGCNVKQLQQDTGASIQVENVSAELPERVIRVSSFEALWNPRSQTIDAILHLQNKTSECSDKGIFTTRLLVSSSKVGCILGQGGQVINEMRRRTLADIRVFSKADKPKCASDDEELVQISGNFDVAKDALAEVASRLRTRCLRDANAKYEPASARAVSEFVPSRSFPGGRPPPSGAKGASSLDRYEFYKGRGQEDKSPSYVVPPSAIGYRNINVDGKIANSAVWSGVGAGGSSIAEISVMRSKLHNPSPGIRDHLPEHLSSAPSMFPAFGHPVVRRSDPYQSYNAEHGVYRSTDPLESPYGNRYHQKAPYENSDIQHVAYGNISAKGSYHY